MPKSSISKQEAFSIRERIEKERKIKSVLEKEVSFVENDRSEDCSHSIKKCNKNREKKNDKPIEASQSGNTKTKSVKRQRVIAACGDKSASITLPIKQSDSKESIIKRPRPRTPTIPNISNYPESIQQICKRVTRHIGRKCQVSRRPPHDLNNCVCVRICYTRWLWLSFISRAVWILPARLDSSG